MVTATDTIVSEPCDYFRYARRRPVPPPVPWTEERGRRARYSDSRRRELLSCGRHRDPLHHEHHHAPAPPETFGLEPGELRQEARRLHAAGWGVDEIRSVLDLRSLDESPR